MENKEQPHTKDCNTTKFFDACTCGADEVNMRIKSIEGLLHSCLDPYTPPIINDTPQSFRIIAKAIEGYY